MATEARAGFRLPWATGSDEPENQPAMGEGPVAQEALEPAMIEIIETAMTIETAATPGPSIDSEGAGGPPARRATEFMAELSRAMQAAIQSARSDSMASLQVEAKRVVEEAQARATAEAADLRREADDDVVAIRDWSKTEIARVREATEARIAARKAGLDGEMEEHAAMIDARIGRVAAVVAAYEAELAVFFERLNAEEDPTGIAKMAGTMPDPPSLADMAASIDASSEPTSERLSRLLAAPPDQEVSTGIDFAAAEAEATSFIGVSESEDERAADEAEQPASASFEGPALAVEDAPAYELSSTRVVVSGLESVANIANFKRSLGRLPGVSAIAVASGRNGAFAFTVGHRLGSSLAASIQAMANFDIQLSEESDEAIIVTALDRHPND